MNFFEYQDQARRNTIWLVILFIIGVAATIVSLYVAVTLILAFTGWAQVSLWSPGLMLFVTAITLGILVFGSGSKAMALRGGGEAVAESLGAQPVQYDSNDPDERRLVNVVEEMAIASGTPVPKLYVMEEDSINAFAAGRDVNDAVIGVTRGCIKKLNRDELQGVIAHEFSHIVNQDMRINMRLMIIIAGLIAISLVGRQVLFSMRYAALGRSRGGGRGDGKGQIAILLIGLAFLVIGAIGVLCSRLIKAAISRQREYLADASAVQFTRHPDGLAGALKSIQEQSARIRHPNAEEASHMFFGDALSRSFVGRMMSTHPPLSKRIERIDPAYQTDAAADQTPVAPGDGPVSMFSAPGGTAANLNVEASRVRNEVGTLSADHLEYGKEVVERLPRDLRRAAHESLGAVAIAYALVLDSEPAHRAKQLAILEDRVAPATLEEVEHLEKAVQELDPWLRMPLAELLLAGLRQLTREQYAQFASSLRAMMLHDDELSIFQFALSKMVLHQLEASFARRRKKHKLISSTSKASEEIRILLSVLAKAGTEDAQERQHAFEAGLERLTDYQGETTIRTGSFEKLNEALDKLARANPKVKEQLIDACSHVVLANKSVNLDEAELLRAVAATLDCPLPPFVPQVRAA